MATSGRGSGVVGYNVQVAVDTQHHLIVAHEVTNDGSDHSQLANMASQAKDVLGADHLDVVADRGQPGCRYDPTPSPQRAEFPPRYNTSRMNRYDDPEDGWLLDRRLPGGLPAFGSAFRSSHAPP
jgi:hypothetical protein